MVCAVEKGGRWSRRWVGMVHRAATEEYARAQRRKMLAFDALTRHELLSLVVDVDRPWVGDTRQLSGKKPHILDDIY